MLPFDINSVVFHFDDFNYGRRSQPYFFLTIATQLFLFLTTTNVMIYSSTFLRTTIMNLKKKMPRCGLRELDNVK
jgi:hypothetical protein